MMIRPCFGFLLATLAIPLAYGQTDTATLSGLVTDPTGAVAINTQVTATETATGLTRSAIANRDGIYTIVLLPPGTYNVSARLPGFSTAEIKDVALRVGDRVELNIKLQVGQTNESVTVSADAGSLQLQTESGERSAVVTNREMRDIAINGRDPQMLMALIPGVVSDGSGWGGFNINGTRVTMKDELIDGSSNVTIGANTAVNVSLNPDAVSEMKVLTSNFQAEYGKAGGAVVQFTTRSGTSQFHGGGWYFRRHDSLNANSFFNNEIGQPRPLYRYNDVGYNIGGPIIIPGTRFNKDRKKLFFFWDQEYLWQKSPNTATSIEVPTAAERKGDFSHSTDGTGNLIVIKDPLTGAAFPGNIIPANRFFSNGQAILNIFPQPNDTTGGFRYNYTSQLSNSPPTHQDVLRVDFNPTDRTRISGRMILSPSDHHNPYGSAASLAWNFPLATLDAAFNPFNYSFNVTHIFSPSLTNEFIFGPGRYQSSTSDPDGGRQKAKYGINIPLLFPNVQGASTLPSMTFGGISNQTTPTITAGYLPRINPQKTYNISDNLLKMWGDHIIKGGIFIQYSDHVFQPQPGGTNGSVNFANNTANPLNTGDPFANALLGIYASFNQASNFPTGPYVYWNVEPYLQDTWKVSRRLTLDYGLRISWIQPQYDTSKQAAFFLPNLYNPANTVRLYAPVLVAGQRRAVDPANVPATLTVNNTLPTAYIGLLVPNVGDPLNGVASAAKGYPPGGFNGRGPQWGPRIGFAWDVTGRGTTVVRGGFGISYDRLSANVIQNFQSSPPTVQSEQLLYGYLSDVGSAAGLLAPLNALGIAPDGKVPNVESTSLGVQRKLGSGTVLDVAYVGTFAHHMFQIRNINSVPYGTTFKAGAQDPSMYPNGVVPAVEAGLPANYTKAGLSFEGDKALPANFLVPYQGYGSINYYEFVGSSNYNSLQVSIRRSLSKTLTFGLSYSWSKALGTGSADKDTNNPYNTRAYDYGLLSFDRTQLLVANYVYNLPQVARLVGNSRFAKAVLNNWELSGITTATSGAPTEMTLTINGVNTGQVLLGTYSITPNLYRVGGTPSTSGGLQVNPSGYTVPSIGDIGPYPNAYLREPGYWNADISLFKNIPLGEGRRLQLRLEMFNAFNHTEFNSIKDAVQLTTSSGATGAAVLASYPNVGITNNLRPAGSSAPLGQFFGEYNGAQSARVIQLGVKMYF